MEANAPKFPIRFAVAGVSFRPKGVATVIVKNMTPICAGELESLAMTVKLVVPAVVGVPLIVPFTASESVRPTGSVNPLPIENECGFLPPIATTLPLNGRFSAILVGKEFATDNGG